MVMAANAPMMTRAAMVEGRPEVGILPTGQVVGVIDELPDVAQVIAWHHSTGRGDAGPSPRVTGGSGSFMDLDFTPHEEEFRRIAGRGWRTTSPPRPSPPWTTADGFEQHRAWERELSAGGWSAVSWPVEYGGQGANLIEWLVFEEEYYRAGAPGRVNQNGIFLLGPTIIEIGTDEQRARFLPPMASGDEIWCQGWSEPDAGSDLAAIRSRAVRDGDDYVLDGQKTWCSRGAFADWMFGLFRTDPDAERHRGSPSSSCRWTPTG